MTKSNGLKPFTFQDTGESVLIRHVSPLLGMKLQSKYPPPPPPKQSVNYGTDEEPNLVEEENTAHPEYLLAMQQYREDMEDRAQKLMIKRGVHVQMTDERKEQVQELREFMKAEFDEDLGEDDKMVYVKYIAIGTPEDMQELMDAITRRSKPTQEAVEAAKAGFPGELSG